MLCTLEIHDLPSLDRQERLGPLAGEIAVKGVDAEGQHTIVSHEHSEFGQPLHPELLQRGLKRPTADTVGLEELPAVPDHGLFVVLQRREGVAAARGRYPGTLAICLFLLVECCASAGRGLSWEAEHKDALVVGQGVTCLLSPSS